MFSLNKETRIFLQQHYITIKNGFINEGLIDYKISYEFNGFERLSYERLDRLYNKALNRNRSNRNFTIAFSTWD
jgi:hypothetical protein